MDNMDHDGDHDHAMMMEMQMSFVNTYKATILFSGWVTETRGQYVGSLIAIFCAGVLAIYLKVLRGKLERSSLVQGKNIYMASLVRALSAFCSYSWDYVLMLVVMTFNVGIFLVCMAGLSCGYALFGARISKHQTTSPSGDNEMVQPLANTSPSYCQCLKPETTNDALPNSTRLSDLDPSCCQV